MKQPKKPPPFKRHTIVWLKEYLFNNAFCTSCNRRIDGKDIHKRCKGKQL